MTQASMFVEEMEQIWGDDPHNLYRQWHNARLRAERFGAIRLYSSKSDMENGYFYQFPDASKVWIHTEGKACRVTGTVGRPRRVRSMKLTLLTLYATTVTGLDGKYHPAVINSPVLDTPYYWPNITFANEDEAYQHAQAAINDVLEAANKVVENWNVIKF